MRTIARVEFTAEYLLFTLCLCIICAQVHARDVLLREMPASADVVCSHPMFGPVSGKDGWQDLPLMVDKVRISNASRCVPCLRKNIAVMTGYCFIDPNSGATNILPCGNSKVAT